MKRKSKIIANKKDAIKSRDVLRESEELFILKLKESEAIFDTTPAMIFYKDKFNNFIRVNTAFSNIMNLPKDKIEGKSLFDIYPKQQAQSYWDDDKEVMKSGKIKINIKEQMNTKNSIIWIETSKIPYVDENGETKGVIGFSVNITERKKEEFIEGQKKLLFQEKLKNEFIADAAHELRTPLAIIRGNVDLMLINGLNDKKSVKKSLNDINHEIEHLSELLTNLSFITSNETEDQGIVLMNQKIDISKIITHAISVCNKIAYKKKILISYKKIKGIHIIGNKKTLEMSFINLIKNAITYGKDNGYIIIKSKLGEHYISFLIEDNGIGISNEDIPKLFYRFYRTKEAKVYKKYGGTGLGLSITKKIIEEHGGNISVESELGKGSTFTISLPIVK